ncbi:50S ribosomal protein L35 [Staphylococcus aureus]|uniref:50S ribosomal protein L35 n=1 Tax=Staphylococcus aureus TaxID=1280 RepID=A0A380EIT9_STAAU|nr:50S ribosomal protein L35 [Staphylococcus aureus]
MPKMKTHRGAAKRVKRTASGQLKTFKSFHISLIRKQEH